MSKAFQVVLRVIDIVLMKLVREMYLCKHFMHFHNSTKLCKSRLPVAWKMLHRRREQCQATKLQVAFLACEIVQIRRQRDTESRATLGRDLCPCWLGNAWHGLAWQERVSPALAPFALHGYPKNRRTLDGTPEGRPASFSNPSSIHQWTQTKTNSSCRFFNRTISHHLQELHNHTGSLLGRDYFLQNTCSILAFHSV